MKGVTGGEKESRRQRAEEKKEDKKDKTVAHKKDEPDKKNKERDLSRIYIMGCTNGKFR